MRTHCVRRAHLACPSTARRAAHAPGTGRTAQLAQGRGGPFPPLLCSSEKGVRPLGRAHCSSRRAPRARIADAGRAVVGVSRRHEGAWRASRAVAFRAPLDAVRAGLTAPPLRAPRSSTKSTPRLPRARYGPHAPVSRVTTRAADAPAPRSRPDGVQTFYSFEFFPPKTDDGVEALWERMDGMVAHQVRAWTRGARRGRRQPGTGHTFVALDLAASAAPARRAPGAVASRRAARVGGGRDAAAVTAWRAAVPAAQRSALSLTRAPRGLPFLRAAFAAPSALRARSRCFATSRGAPAALPLT